MIYYDRLNYKSKTKEKFFMFTNWKTTVISLASSILFLVAKGFITGHVDMSDLFIAGGVTGTGAMAKDHDVTGIS